MKKNDERNRNLFESEEDEYKEEIEESLNEVDGLVPLKSTQKKPKKSF